MSCTNASVTRDEANKDDVNIKRFSRYSGDKIYLLFLPSLQSMYRQISNIRRTSVGYKLVDHSVILES